MANGRYLPPYSGHHQFEPNSVVTEHPLLTVKSRKGKKVKRTYRSWI